MNTDLAFGWRPIETDFSTGLDFLGLASPIERILDAETSGITNATTRARYFSIIPWYYWRYHQLEGKASARNQRQFAKGFEMLHAYANIAWLEQKQLSRTGIIRRDYCQRVWKEQRESLPLRGQRISDSPSPMDAALYGPSLRRLNLLGQYSQLVTLREAGEIMAKEVDRSLRRLTGYKELVSDKSVDVSTVQKWAAQLSLDLPKKREAELIRALLFSYGRFAQDETPARVFSMMLLLSVGLTTRKSFTSSSIEIAITSGKTLGGKTFTPDPILNATYRRWRVLALLKNLRHASELAFAAVHAFVGYSPERFMNAESAALHLISETFNDNDSGVPSDYSDLLLKYETEEHSPGWHPSEYTPTVMLGHALHICAWCHAILRSESGQLLLEEKAARTGDVLDADLYGYYEQLEILRESDGADALKWLCVDRAIARHFHVASRKLAMHDTFRLIEDENGVKASSKCPIAGIAIRVEAMFSLIADIKLLQRTEDGFQVLPETRTWYKEQLARVQISFEGNQSP